MGTISEKNVFERYEQSCIEKSLPKVFSNKLLGVVFGIFFIILATAVLTFIPLSIYKSFKSESKEVVHNKLVDAQLNLKSLQKSFAQGKTKITDLERKEKRDLASLVMFVSNEIIKKSSVKVDDPDKLAFQIVSESLIANEDPFFVTSIVLAESTFRTDARSKVGALGLMQIMPKTGKYIANRINYKWQGTSSLKDPETNLRLGISYIKYLKKTFKSDTHKVLVAYNWGPGNVLKGRKAPKISLNYSSKIQKNHTRWKKQYLKAYDQYSFATIDTLIS